MVVFMVHLFFFAFYFLLSNSQFQSVICLKLLSGNVLILCIFTHVKFCKSYISIFYFIVC